jgi:hypothetical protein
MPEKISCGTSGMTFAIEALTMVMPDLNDFIDHCPGPELEVCLTVNGKEVPFGRTVELFSNFLEEDINRMAAALVDQKFQGFINTIEQLRSETKWKVREVFRLE